MNGLGRKKPKETTVGPIHASTGELHTIRAVSTDANNGGHTDPRCAYADPESVPRSRV